MHERFSSRSSGVGGYDEIVARIPKAAPLPGGVEETEIAYFGVCSKSGSATWLDIWDCDQFDGFTDMGCSATEPPRCVYRVECLMDNISFGLLPVTRTILQLHFSVLSAGGHHFRIRQVSGPFFFLSLTVYRF